MKRLRIRRRITKLAVGIVAIAAMIVASVATVAGLHHAPARRSVEIEATKPNRLVETAKTVTTKRSAAGVPAGGMVVGRGDGRVVLVGANWHDVRTVVPSIAGTVVSGLAVLPDGEHVVVLRRASTDPAAAEGCGAVSEIDLRSGASSALGQAVSFSLSPDGVYAALVQSHDRAGRCTGGSASNGTATHEQSRIVVRGLSDNSSHVFALGSGLGGGAAFSPSGSELAVSLCSTGTCNLRVLDVASNGALASRLSSPPIVVLNNNEASVYAPRVTWNARDLYVVHDPVLDTDASEVRQVDPSTGIDEAFVTTIGGRDIASIGNRVYMIDRSGTTLLRIAESTGDVTTISGDVTAISIRLHSRNDAKSS